MKEIDQLKDAAGAYQRWALEARRDYIKLRLRQDPEIRKLYIGAADRVAAELKSVVSGTQKMQLEVMEAALRREGDRVAGDLTVALESHIKGAVTAGASYSQAISMDLLKKTGFDILNTAGFSSLFATVNAQAVEACWARTKNGLHLSNRIWQQGEKLRTNMSAVVQESVAMGQDAVTTARMLQQYVKQGKQSLAAQYPNMMKRMAGRVPGDISYEALRLARTEMTAAFGEGSISAAQASPSYLGMKWILSGSHPMADICDELAAHDEGLGKGVYAPGNEPMYPAHPNCLCILIPVHEQPEDFVQKLKQWKEDPTSEPNIEKWYQDIYKKEQPRQAAQKPFFLCVSKHDRQYDDLVDRQRIENDLKLIPSRHRRILEQEGVTIQTGHEVSRYDRGNKVIQVGENPVPGEVVHEVAHAIETELDLYHNDKFLDVLKNGLPDDNEIVFYIKTDMSFTPEIEILDYPNSKFISTYQSRLYDMDIDGKSRIDYDSMKFNPKVLGEYFSEGYGAYITEPEKLKKNDPALHKLIKGLVD